MSKIDVNNAECSICSKEAHEREGVEEKFGYRLVLNIPIQRCKMSIDTYDKLYTKFGEEAANDTLADVQDGKIKEETLLKYLN